MTALDILNKHKTAGSVNYLKDDVLAAMREIYELGDRDGYKRRDDELERTTTDIDLDDRMKQLFPEK